MADGSEVFMPYVELGKTNDMVELVLEWMIDINLLTKNGKFVSYSNIFAFCKKYMPKNR